MCYAVPTCQSHPVCIQLQPSTGLLNTALVLTRPGMHTLVRWTDQSALTALVAVLACFSLCHACVLAAMRM